MKYKWLLFDLDGTLFDYDRSEVEAFKKTFEDFELPYREEFLKIYHSINNAMWKKFELGEINLDNLKVERFENLMGKIGYKMNADEFSNAYMINLSNCTFLLDGVEDFLESLKGKVKMMLITNGLKLVQRPRLKQSTIENYFEGMIISEEVGAAKPSKIIFESAFEKMNMPDKKDVLMIGDSLTSDIQGGINYNLDTCWLNSFSSKTGGIKPNYTIEKISDLKKILMV